MRVYPHLMRHTGATHDAASGVSHYKLCKKYGWTMTSSVAQDYIDRAGINELEIAQDTFSREQESRLKKQVHKDVLCPDT